MADDEDNPAFVGRFGALNRLLASLNSVRALLHCMRDHADFLRKQSGYDFAYDQYGECVGRLDRPYGSDGHSSPVGTIDLHGWYYDVRAALVEEGDDPGDATLTALEEAAPKVGCRVGRLLRYGKKVAAVRAFINDYLHFEFAPEWARKLVEELAEANRTLDTFPEQILQSLDRLQQTAWRPMVRHDTLDPAGWWTADALADDWKEFPEDILRRAFIDKARTPQAYDDLNRLVENLVAYQRQLVAVRGEAPILDTADKQKQAGLQECVGVVAWLISQLGCAEWYAKRAADYGAKITKAATNGSIEERYRNKQRDEANERDKHEDAIRNAPGSEELRQFFNYHDIPWTKAGVEKQRDRLFVEQGTPKAEADALTLREFLSRLRGDPPQPETITPVEMAPSVTPTGQPSIEELEKVTPALDRTSGAWIKNTQAAELDGLEVRTLSKYRSDGDKSADGTFGRDCDGRIWRRAGTPNSHPWYLRSSLRSVAKP